MQSRHPKGVRLEFSGDSQNSLVLANIGEASLVVILELRQVIQIRSWLDSGAGKKTGQIGTLLVGHLICRVGTRINCDLELPLEAIPIRGLS